jgi:hypothetical protein
MTTLQARTWAQFAQRASKPRDHRRFWAGVRTALGFVLLAVLLIAALALRAFMFVHFS